MNKQEKQKIKKLIDNQEFGKAIDNLNKIIDKNPKDIDAWYNIGFTYDHKAKTDKQRKELYPKAEKAYKKTLEINPKFEKGLGGLGMLMWYKSRHTSSNKNKKEFLEKSSNYLNQAYKINKNAGLLPIMANIEFEKGEYKKAENYLTKAIKNLKDPFSVYVNGAFRLAEIGKSDKAKKYSKKALENAEKHWDIESKTSQEYIKKLKQISKTGKLKKEES